MNYIYRTRGVGDPSSEFGYDQTGELFEAKLRKRKEEYDQIYAEFVEWMKTKVKKPEWFQQLFLRYYEEFIESEDKKEGTWD